MIEQARVGLKVGLKVRVRVISRQGRERRLYMIELRRRERTITIKRARGMSRFDLVHKVVWHDREGGRGRSGSRIIIRSDGRFLVVE